LREIHPRTKGPLFLCPNFGAITGILLTQSVATYEVFGTSFNLIRRHVRLNGVAVSLKRGL
jgi:hypothetical protein